MYTGFITYYHRKKQFGFIDSLELDLQDIFFHNENCKKGYRNIIRGDRVEFDITRSTEELFKYEANSIGYLDNESKENLKRSFTEQTILQGFIKSINGNYFVKDKQSYVMIKLLISKFEDIGDEYEKHLNKLIDYKIIDYSSAGRIKAVKAHRHFSDDYFRLKSQQPILGKVIEKVKGGYSVLLSNNIVGFLPFSLLVKANKTLAVEEHVHVVCIKIDENTGNVVFNVVENIEIEQARLDEIASIKVGDKKNGKIKSVVHFGLFVTINLVDALLHVKHIINNYENIKSNEEKKAVCKLLRDKFPEGMEIEVTIDEIKDGKYSLTWDKNSFNYEKLTLAINK